jgi:hypothetical protein
MGRERPMWKRVQLSSKKLLGRRIRGLVEKRSVSQCMERFGALLCSTPGGNPLRQ